MATASCSPGHQGNEIKSNNTSLLMANGDWKAAPTAPGATAHSLDKALKVGRVEKGEWEGKVGHCSVLYFGGSLLSLYIQHNEIPGS